MRAWAEVTGFDVATDSQGRKSRGTGLQFGADIAVGPNAVAGLALGVQSITAKQPGVSQKAEIRFAQPYFAYRSGAWRGEASLIYGAGELDRTSAAGEGTGRIRLTAASFTGAYDIALQNGWTASPTLGLIVGRERTEGRSGTLAGAGSEGVTFQNVSLGARFTREVAGGSYFAGLHGDWLNTKGGSAVTQAQLTDDGWSGRVEIGGDFALDNGLRIGGALEVGGLGGNGSRTVRAGLTVRYTF